MQLVTNGDRRTRALLEKCRRERLSEPLPRQIQFPSDEQIISDTELIDSVTFSKDIH
jgi:hypothetical protein